MDEIGRNGYSLSRGTALPIIFLGDEETRRGKMALLMITNVGLDKQATLS